ARICTARCGSMESPADSRERPPRAGHLLRCSVAVVLDVSSDTSAGTASSRLASAPPSAALSRSRRCGARALPIRAYAFVALLLLSRATPSHAAPADSLVIATPPASHGG